MMELVFLLFLNINNNDDKISAHPSTTAAAKM